MHIRSMILLFFKLKYDEKGCEMSRWQGLKNTVLLSICLHGSMFSRIPLYHFSLELAKWEVAWDLRDRGGTPAITL